MFHGSSGDVKARADSRSWLSTVEESDRLRGRSRVRDFSPRIPFCWMRRRACCLEAEESSDGRSAFHKPG